MWKREWKTDRRRRSSGKSWKIQKGRRWGRRADEKRGLSPFCHFILLYSGTVPASSFSGVEYGGVAFPSASVFSSPVSEKKASRGAGLDCTSAPGMEPDRLCGKRREQMTGDLSIKALREGTTIPVHLITVREGRDCFSRPPVRFGTLSTRICIHRRGGTGKLFRADGMVRRSAGCLCEGGAVRLYPCSGGASSQTAGRYLTDCFRCFASAGI